MPPPVFQPVASNAANLIHAVNELRLDQYIGQHGQSPALAAAYISVAIIACRADVIAKAAAELMPAQVALLHPLAKAKILEVQSAALALQWVR